MQKSPGSVHPKTKKRKTARRSLALSKSESLYQEELKKAQLYSSSAWVLSRKLTADSYRDKQRLLPVNVLRALSLEQYFKILLQINNEEKPRSQRPDYQGLGKVFNSLEDNLQQKMEAEFSRILLREKLPDVLPLLAEQKEQVPRELRGNLEAWDSLLQHFRTTSREVLDPHIPQAWFSRQIEKVVKRAIFSLKPDLQGKPVARRKKDSDQ